ncbi:DUF222 domain-containing protein, partial [Streptomyces roseolus]|uniref:DUF222 domain-containing protein n=1 Tax=Streptomyces roseolus TaxID=67358 RepID=UPI003661D0E5
MRSSSSPAPQQRVTDPLLSAATTLLDTTGTPLTPLSDDEILDALRGLERARRILTAVEHRLITETAERALPARTGTGTLKRLLIHTLRLSHPDATARITATKTLGTWHDLDGTPVQPLHPATAAAQADGDISTDHTREITKILKHIPGSITNLHFEA